MGFGGRCAVPGCGAGAFDIIHIRQSGTWHEFVAPAAPPPPTENARAGAEDRNCITTPDGDCAGTNCMHHTGPVDEAHWRAIAHLLARDLACRMNGSKHGPDCNLITAALIQAAAAGRARGIEEERERCEGIAREHDLCRDSACRVSSMIADAIAKEMPDEKA